MFYTVLVAATGDGPGLQATLSEVQAQMAALEDEAAQAGLEPCSGELIAVLNRPRESFSAIERASLERWVDRIHFDRQGNKVRALNSAIVAARGQWVLFTEQEALPSPGWLATHLANVADDDQPWCGAGGPITPVFPVGGAPLWLRQLLAVTESSGVGPWHRLQAGPEYTLRDGLGPMPFGLNSIYRREVLVQHPLPEELGARDAAGLRSGEDVALAVHLLSRGERLRYHAGAEVVLHVPPRRFAQAYAKAIYANEGLGRGLAIAPGRVRSEAQRTLQKQEHSAQRERRWGLGRLSRTPADGKVGRDLQALTRSAMLSAWAAQ